jgi:hypothetical protein
MRLDGMFDFFRGIDQLDFPAIDANAVTRANERFAFAGTNAAANAAWFKAPGRDV